MPGDDDLKSYLSRVADHRLLTAGEECELARRLADGDDGARHALIRHNIRLVISVARRFTDRGVPLADLIQSGIVGLDRAARKFDPERGYKFSTYATWWIRKAIQGCLRDGANLIHVPGHVSDRRADVRAELRRNPEATTDEVALALDCELIQVERALGAAEVVTSLDREVAYGDGGARSLLDTVPDPHAADPSDVAEDPRRVRAALTALTDVQRRVIELRFGFAGGDSLSLAEVAAATGLPQAAVQQAQRQALTRLREVMAV